MAGKYALPCICCGVELENIDKEVEINQPYNGTAFTTHGHYGSTAFDPMDGHYLEINICDACLILRRDRVLEGRDRRPIIEPTYLKGDLNDAERTTPDKAEYKLNTIVGWDEDYRERLVSWFPEKEVIDDVLKVTIRERNLYPLTESEVDDDTN